MSKRIRKARRRRGYSRDRLAQLLGVSLSHLAELENGSAIPTVPVLRSLCLTLGVSADYLLFDRRKLSAKCRKRGPGTLQRADSRSRVF